MKEELRKTLTEHVRNLSRRQELIAEAHVALRALNAAAEGDSSDAEIEAGRDVADVLERLLDTYRLSDDALQSIPEGEQAIAAGTPFVTLDDTLKRAEEEALHVCSDECNPGNCEIAHNREFGWDYGGES